MEIKSVTSEVKNKYPKINKVGKENIIDSIPSKWLKLGGISLVIAMMMKHDVFATADFTTSDFAFEPTISGNMQVLAHETFNIVFYPTIISAVIFIITGLSIMITKIKSKKQSKPKKVKKWIKVIFIISMILFILSMILSILVWLNN